PDALLFIAKTYHLQHDFRNATQTYKQFLSTTKTTHPLRGMAKDALLRCGYALRRNHNQSNVIVENLGSTINNQWDDFAPVPSPIYSDRIYFSSVRAENLGGLRNDAGYQDADLGFYCTDMYSSDIVNENWSIPRPMTALLNSPRHDVILDFSDDGQVMYYFQGFSLYAGEVFVDTFKTIQERTLTTANLQSPFKPELGDTAPFFYNGNTLVFASRREGGFGGLDLYYSVKRDGIWTGAKNMGAVINSTYDETTPFLAANGQTLYFSSNHSQRSRGGYDIFKADFSVKGGWATPENLGEPVNSAGDDRYFRLTKDGYNAFFASRRKDSEGGLDIYSAYFKNYQPEQQIDNNAVVFHAADSNLAAGDKTGNDKNSTAIQYVLEPLFYENENNLINNSNQQQIQKVSALLEQYPSLKILITAHSDDSEPEKFDLFFSIKRAERIALYLVDNGINEQQIVLNGVGGKYPLAKGNLSGSNKLLGKKLNRRITIDIINLAKEPIQVSTQYPEINATIATFEYKSYQKLNRGLIYRIQIANSPQMYKGDLIVRYPHALVEKNMNESNYQYLVGRYQTYTSARELQKDIQANGVANPQIVPYLKGQKLSTDVAERYVTEYPDLAQFIEAQQKE
ncbi:MAG: OmpA family protein, partial [Saprospiraceae bacterium]